MKVHSYTYDNVVVFDNFIVVKKKDTYFGIYEKGYRNNPVCDEITHGETLHAACKKAKLLQIGYNICKNNM